MTHSIFARVTASVSELKKNPMATLAAADGAPVAILDRNTPVFYCVPAAVYESMIEGLEDTDLNALADSRRSRPVVMVSLDDL